MFAVRASIGFVGFVTALSIAIRTSCRLEHCSGVLCLFKYRVRLTVTNLEDLPRILIDIWLGWFVG